MGDSSLSALYIYDHRKLHSRDSDDFDPFPDFRFKEYLRGYNTNGL
ncbi:hypothetical protein TRIP_C80002 [Candidatus Zixiibacteriota bacterium]|nr:hypothetical protein TRIP_C80002 [candidate division Zixibacteria bacterium]